MSERFVGIEQAQTYDAPGVRENSCLAVDLAMLGVGGIDEINELLVSLGISTPDGISEVVEDTELDINEHKVIIGAPRPKFSVEAAITDTKEQFEQGNGAIITLPLHPENTESFDGHMVLAAGMYVKDLEVTGVLLGDSLLDGMQRISPSDAVDKLEQTVERFGAIYSSHVKLAN
ncbi:MAG: hypothetical protein ACHQT9_01575 [Candidatus Saccharimonadales bacterium]